ncbi:MAG TPA: hypothetical protein VK574_13445 [Terracidiphilus sp.]|nr:hypothetical protein [Terracidiphilus sp.]
MDTRINEMMRLLEVGGIVSLLLPISGLSAELRSSETIEPIDLVKAIYIVDLEHVAMYWNDWRNFEKFVLCIPLTDGKVHSYLNRMEQYLAWQLALRENAGQLMTYPNPSQIVRQIVFDAEQIAGERERKKIPPSSCDLMFSVCKHDRSLSETLQHAGLQFELLQKEVAGPGAGASR